MRVIGLGSGGCKLAKAFSKFPQYEAIAIDTHKDAMITIKKRASHEEYDAHFPNLKKKLRFSNEEVLVITAGSGKISGGILRLLEQIKNNRVRVMYIQSDLSLISDSQRRQDKIVKNVLQEYARSGLLEVVYLVDDVQVQRSIGDMSIIGYYDTINQAIVNTLHMVNVFKNSEPIIGNFVNPSEISRIATLGIVNLDDDKEEESWFYNLTNVRDMVYYYGINEEDLKNDGTLFRKIKNFVKTKAENDVSVSYGIYETTYDQKYCYCIQYSSMVQSYKELLDDQDIG